MYWGLSPLMGFREQGGLFGAGTLGGILLSTPSWEHLPPPTPSHHHSYTALVGVQVHHWGGGRVFSLHGLVNLGTNFIVQLRNYCLWHSHDMHTQGLVGGHTQWHSRGGLGSQSHLLCLCLFAACRHLGGWTGTAYCLARGGAWACHHPTPQYHTPPHHFKCTIQQHTATPYFSWGLRGVGGLSTPHFSVCHLGSGP